MAGAKQGMLMVWTDIPAEVEAEFNEWYNREHLPDRINKVPGFIRARRFAAASGEPRYLALYETQSVEVMQSEPYLALNRNPDPMSRRFIPLFRNTIKAICDVSARVGQGEGAFLALLPVSADPIRRTEFRDWICHVFLPDTVRSGGVIAATFAEGRSEIVKVAAANYTRMGDRWVDDLILIEAASEAGLFTASARLDGKMLAQHGGTLPLMKQPCCPSRGR